MATSLATIVEKKEESLVDRAATSLKVMFGVGYADIAQEDLEERLYKFMDAIVEIAKESADDPDDAIVRQAVDNVMITPVYAGWDNREITEEVLQVIDMVVNREIEVQLGKPEQEEEKLQNQALLAQIIREAKDFVNGAERRKFAARNRKPRRFGQNIPPEVSAERNNVPVPGEPVE
jgi:hypothetical protein